MNTATITVTIKGVIVYDTALKTNRFLDYLNPDDFSDGVFHSSSNSKYVLLREHTIFADVQGVDLTKIQLDALDAQKVDLTATYQAALTKLEAERQSLLAIECTGV